MIDATKLDDAGRCLASAILRAGPAFRHTACSALDDVMTLARQAIAYRALIDAHNAGCSEACDARQAGPNPGSGGLCGAMKRTSKGRCVDCPRLDMIDVAGIDAGRAEEPGAC